MAKNKDPKSKLRTSLKSLNPAVGEAKNATSPVSAARAPTKLKAAAAAKPKRKVVRAKARKPANQMAVRVRNQTPAHARRPLAKTYHVFWSTGMLGGIMVVTAALWSAFRTLAPAPGALAVTGTTSELGIPQRTPASADPPSPAQAPQSQFPKLPEQIPQQQQQQKNSAVVHPSAALQEAFDHATQTAPEHRVAWWSGWLVKSAGNRAELKSLGPGPAIQDDAPLLPDLFNCTIFVETAAALARSRTPDLFFQRLIEIRYHDGKPEYLSRNHFPEADWRANNAQAGIISDITSAVAQAGGASLKIEEETLDRAKWLASQKADSPGVARALAEAGPPGPVWSQTQTVRVSFISRHDMPRVLGRIPDGAVISFVRKKSANRPVLITHQGIVVSEGGKVWLRHGSPGGRVRSVLLRDYLRRNVEFVGFTLDRVNDAGGGINS